MPSLPITKVVLYKHGMASFHRRGTVDGENEQIDMYFQGSEMNDVLKTLTVLVGGGVSSISYDNSKPTAKRLEESAIALQDGDIMMGLLSQLKGVQVMLSMAEGSATGVLMGYTRSPVANEHPTVNIYDVESNQILAVPVNTITGVEILEEAVKEELKSHLSVLKTAKKKDMKRLTIHTSGAGSGGEIFVAYTVEAPVWKVSYRLILDKDEGSTSTADASGDGDGDAEAAPPAMVRVQGWAIIDNVTDEPWDGVNLTLVVGEPNSFKFDLFSPKYRHRREVQEGDVDGGKPVEGTSAPPPMPTSSRRPHHEPRNRIESRAMHSNRMPQQQQMMQQQMMPANLLNMAPQQMMPSNDFGNAGEPESDLGSSMDVNANTEEVGDLFSYEIATPVTVSSNQSALVPIVNETAAGARVALWNKDEHQKHPRTCVLFTNTTGLTLESGPVTVLDGDAYVGEAVIDQIKPGTTRFIEYSTERGVDVWEKHRTISKTVSFKIVNGTMRKTMHTVHCTKYFIRNRTRTEFDFYIKHRFRKGTKLVSEPAPTNPNPIQYYIFKTKAPGNETSFFLVKEREVTSSPMQLTPHSVNESTIVSWASLNYIDDDTHAQFHEYFALVRRVAELQNRKSAAESQVSSLYSNQQRLRDNIRTLGSSNSEKKLREKYVQSLDEDETSITRFRREVEELTNAISDAQNESIHFLNRISYETDVEAGDGDDDDDESLYV